MTKNNEVKILRAVTLTWDCHYSIFVSRRSRWVSRRQKCSLLSAAFIHISMLRVQPPLSRTGPITKANQRKSQKRSKNSNFFPKQHQEVSFAPKSVPKIATSASTEEGAWHLVTFAIHPGRRRCGRFVCKKAICSSEWKFFRMRDEERLPLAYLLLSYAIYPSTAGCTAKKVLVAG